jgi:hypothetical protein
MHGRQTLNRPNSEQRKALIAGAERFNRAEYFEAHEDWEIPWRTTGSPDRPQIQAAILVCGTFVLLEKGRIEPALRLARLAIERFAEAAVQAELYGVEPILKLPGAENRLLAILARIRLGESSASLLASEAKGLRAVIAPE